MKDNISMIFRYVLYTLFIGLLTIESYCIVRTQFELLMVLFGLLFVLYIYLYKLSIGSKKILYELIVLAFVSRVILLPSIPNLSDDFYRFLWDGWLTNQGINPFKAIPTAIIKEYSHLSFPLQWLQGMNSANYYTVYPPLNQLLFSVFAWFAEYNVRLGLAVMRLFLLIGDVLALFYLLKLLAYLKKPKELALLYILNPLVIIECVGNLHIEGLMVGVLAGTLWYFVQQKHFKAATWYAVAIHVKLLPLLLAPYLFFQLRGKLWLWLVIGISISVILCVPFVNQELIASMQASLSLYFNHFEFNASLYNLIVALIGVEHKEMINNLFPIITGILIMSISYLMYKKREGDVLTLIKIGLIVWCTYLLFSRTVHPWYIVPVLFFGILLGYRFVIVWSVLIVMTYITYVSVLYVENKWLIAVEYGIVGLIMLVGWCFKWQSKSNA